MNATNTHRAVIHNFGTVGGIPHIPYANRFVIAPAYNFRAIGGKGDARDPATVPIEFRHLFSRSHIEVEVFVPIRSRDPWAPQNYSGRLANALEAGAEGALARLPSLKWRPCMWCTAAAPGRSGPGVSVVSLVPCQRSTELPLRDSADGSLVGVSSIDPKGSPAVRDAPRRKLAPRRKRWTSSCVSHAESAFKLPM